MIIKYASDNLSKLGFNNARNIPKDTILVVCIGTYRESRIKWS
ncbi:hypothetical protein OLP50_05365 [Campylobacter jejuni]|nr:MULTISPECIES: hypothetical protein [Campylobacter]MCW1351193.1 hypothetical protein [Campylobacter jejuni]MCW1366213.1 hypothetical protein [Campylobacter jejuni]MCW1368687.1 hypothetical protein [Campylobacter jejuni]MCW1871957.1 hypothetical protein [Campylobacter jejuni]